MGIVAETIILVGSPVGRVDLRCSMTRRCWRCRPRFGMSLSLEGTHDGRGALFWVCVAAGAGVGSRQGVPA